MKEREFRGFTKAITVADTCCDVFIERSHMLIFEPVVILKDGSCVVESPILAFIMIAQYFKVPVYAIANSY